VYLEFAPHPLNDVIIAMRSFARKERKKSLPVAVLGFMTRRVYQTLLASLT
jgi:hypothetical protein